MPNKIIDQTGAYLSEYFTGDNGTWRLVGSESSGDTEYSKKPKQWYESTIASTIDEFVNIKTGERIETTRIKVYNKAESGAIFLK